MKYILIGFVVIGVLGVLVLVYPMFGNKYGQPVSAEEVWKKKIANCNEIKVPKNVNAAVKKYRDDAKEIMVSGPLVIYRCPDGMFVY